MLAYWAFCLNSHEKSPVSCSVFTPGTIGFAPANDAEE